MIIPLLPAALLFMHRGNLSAPKVQLQLGYIYRMYRQALLTVSQANNMHALMQCDVLIINRAHVAMVIVMIPALLLFVALQELV